MKTQEIELEILENIHINNSHVRQRDLAEIAGLSLGMTNAILKRLVQKGWLIIKKINNRNIRYAVSPKGVEEITRRSYRYFKRTIKNVVYYKEVIDGVVKKGRQDGFKGLILVGKSDLDFIVEHSCGVYGIDYVKNEKEYNEQVFYVYSENYIPDEDIRQKDSIFLQKLVM